MILLFLPPFLPFKIDLATRVQPSHPASLRPSSVPGANLVSRAPLLPPPFRDIDYDGTAVRRYASVGAMAVGTNGLACGSIWQFTANTSECAASWLQHACSFSTALWVPLVWTPYRLLTSTVWFHPGRKASRGEVRWGVSMVSIFSTGY